jgi:hypothetical protein
MNCCNSRQEDDICMLMLLSNHMGLSSPLNWLSISIQPDSPPCNIAMQGTADKPCRFC